jgi:hypothetical protein
VSREEVDPRIEAACTKAWNDAWDAASGFAFPVRAAKAWEAAEAAGNAVATRIFKPKEVKP